MHATQLRVDVFLLNNIYPAAPRIQVALGRFISPTSLTTNSDTYIDGLRDANWLPTFLSSTRDSHREKF